MTGDKARLLGPRLHRRTAILTDGFDPQLSVGSARPAVFRSSTYVFSSPEAGERAFALALGKEAPLEGESPELIYARLSHPNAEILEEQLLPLEPGATSAMVFNSGMAAISTVALALCRPGGRIVYTTPTYGGTVHLIHQLLEPFGITAVAIDAGDTAGLLDAISTTPALELILIETPANPTLRVTDIAAAAVAAGSRERRPVVAVDNTFLGPAFQHPLTLGADLALYSATKYLSGFSDMLGGVVMARDPELDTRIRGARAILGNILQPDECWLLTGRLPTVTLRMRQQCAGAQQIVKRLNGHPAIQRLLYPTLVVDPEQRAIAASQSSAAGAIISLQLHGGKAAAFEFLRTLKIIRDAVSLGGVESLACHPASTTHSEFDAEALARSGVTPSLVRISVGLEDPRDLLDDIRVALDRALAASTSPAVSLPVR